MAEYTITLRNKDNKTVKADNAYVQDGNLCLINFVPGTEAEVDVALFHWEDVHFFTTDRRTT